VSRRPPSLGRGGAGSGSISRDVVIGNAAWLQESGVQMSAAARQLRARLEGGGATVVAAAVDGCAVALVAIADQMKPEAAPVLAALKRRGIQCWMITGDSRWGGGAARGRGGAHVGGQGG
jgi:cation transport ATPase